MRPMKWHIFNNHDDTPLCWNDRCIEFDTEADARKFYDSMSYAKQVDGCIKECIIYYDGGYVNLSGYTEDQVLAEIADAHVEMYYNLKHMYAGSDDPIVQLALDDYREFIRELAI